MVREKLYSVSVGGALCMHLRKNPKKTKRALQAGMTGQNIRK
jgi:hypothetical protein